MAEAKTDRRWETQAEVDQRLAETGVTMDQVRRWRREGLLPKVCQHRSPYRGSTVLYPAGTCAQIRVVQALFREKKDVDYARRQLWVRGGWVEESYWRGRLQRFATLLDRFLPLIIRLRSRADRHEDAETLQEKAARKPLAKNIILSRIKKRLRGPDLAMFYRVMLELAGGKFGGFEFPTGDEIRAPDETAAIKAFDIGNSEKHAILGARLSFVGVLPSALGHTAEAVKGSFAEAANAPAAEIAAARTDALNGLNIALCLYDAFKWVYGDGAFGLRFFAWLARKAPDTIFDGLVLAMLRLRRIPGATRSSEEIAVMAQEAQSIWRASKQYECLWQTDPRFSEILAPKRVKAALADRVALARWQEELRAITLRGSEYPKGQLP